jgi:hypothetical protein
MNSQELMRFRILTAMSMNIVVFWDAGPSNLVDINRRFEALTTSIIITLMMEE